MWQDTHYSSERLLFSHPVLSHVARIGFSHLSLQRPLSRDTVGSHIWSCQIYSCSYKEESACYCKKRSEIGLRVPETRYILFWKKRKNKTKEYGLGSLRQILFVFADMLPMLLKSTLFVCSMEINTLHGQSPLSSKGRKWILVCAYSFQGSYIVADITYNFFFKSLRYKHLTHIWILYNTLHHF